MWISHRNLYKCCGIYSKNYLDELACIQGCVWKVNNSFLCSLSRVGRVIIISIHQPRYSIYKLFDSLTLMSRGHIVYHGPTVNVLNYFSTLGKWCVYMYVRHSLLLVMCDTVYGKILVGEKIGESWAIRQNFPHQYSQIHGKRIWHMHWLLLICQNFPRQ